MSEKPRIAITSGEPAGIGPEISLAAAVRQTDAEIVVLGDRTLLAQRARAAGIEAPLQDWTSARPPGHGAASVLHEPTASAVAAGRLDSRNARYVLALLDRAVAGVQSGEFDAIVTAPVQKSIINAAGVAFSGHTEYLAEKVGAPRSVMLLAAGNLRVALATTHLALRAVPAAITAQLLDSTLAIVDRDVRRLWGIPKPRIGVCGLNPHAGESGHLGDEELRVIGPAIERARQGGIDARGPLPADTVFVQRTLDAYDVVLAMYHDQGLPVLKHAGFGHAVNVTLGLPIIRTSVDHGTALDLAGTGRADIGSLESAIALAADFARRRRAERAA
jgi:4-hydroxythreonine-4-phosphate dehydrogenase